MKNTVTFNPTEGLIQCGVILKERNSSPICMSKTHLKKKNLFFSKHGLERILCSFSEHKWIRKFTQAQHVNLLEGCSQEVQGHVHGALSRLLDTPEGKSPAFITLRPRGC